MISLSALRRIYEACHVLMGKGRIPITHMRYTLLYSAKCVLEVGGGGRGRSRHRGTWQRRAPHTSIVHTSIVDGGAYGMADGMELVMCTRDERNVDIWSWHLASEAGMCTHLWTLTGRFYDFTFF